MAVEKTVSELAAYLGGRAVGDGSAVVRGVSSLDDAGEGQITFLGNPKYAAKVATTKATAVVVPPGAELHGKTGIEMANPYLGFAKLLTLFHVKSQPVLGIMPGAMVSPNAIVGSDVTIYPGAYVAEGAKLGNRVTLHPGVALYEGVEIGDDTVIYANVTVRERCRLGSRVIIHSGTVIGSDGFGYAPDGRGYYKIPQIGIVVIEDEVEIGANTTVDRAALGVTLIRRGTKIDNLVQIAHNCVIGENCIIVSQVGIAGSARIGNHVTIGGQTGVAGHLEIGDNVMVGGQSGIHGDIPANQVMTGSPAMPHKEWLKASMAFPKIPELRKTVNALEKRVRELEEKLLEKK